MAALRGPSSTSTRKSSRFSSPATVPRVERDAASNVNPPERAKESVKTFMDKWVEPPLRAPAPSFEDHRGMERVGVLEHFQPLGQPPTQKLLQKLKLAPPKPGRATPVQSEEVSTPTNGVEDMSTGSPAEEPRRSLSAGEGTMRTGPAPAIVGQKEKDEDSRPEVTPAPVVTKPNMTPRNSVSIPPTPLPNGGFIYRGNFHPETIKQHVEAAIRRAEIESPELASGMRKLCADSELDPALWSILDAVLNQSQTRAQYKIFHRYIRAGRKEFSWNSTPAARGTSSSHPASNHHFTPTQYTAPATTSSAPRQLPANSPSFPQASLQTPPIFHPQPTQPVAPLRFHPAPQLPAPQPLLAHQPQMSSPKSSESASIAPQSAVESKPVAEMAPALTNGETPTAESFQEGLQNLEDTTHKRSQSVSSSSSLSSAKSLDAETFAPAISEEAQINGTRAAAKSGPDQRQAAAHKPGGNKSRAAKIGLFSIFPNTHKTNARKQSGSADIDELELTRRRHRLQQNQGFHEDYNSRFHTGESSERATPAPLTSHPIRNPTTSIPEPAIHPHNVTSFQATLSSPVEPLPPSELNLRNGTSKKRSRDESEIDEEETQTPRSSPGPLLVPPPPGAANISRSSTPRGTRLPPAKKIKKSARVMVSPNKLKSGGTTAGISRAVPGRDSTAGNGVESCEEENNDFCAACGANGQLLCCDGCPNSFHFSCLEPPMKGPPEGSWYCPRCVARKHHGLAQVNGIIGRLVIESDDINPKAFALPVELRDYFDGIRSGEEGDYEDIGLPRTQTTDVKMNRAGFIEEPDYKKLRDAKGSVIFCYRCRQTSNGKRDIIPCDFCPYRWHLDCLDPPLAVPPRRRNGDKPNVTWRCPLHIENDLRNLGNGEGSVLGRQPRHRMPKTPIPRDVSMSRRFRNNGAIDVQLVKDDERIEDVEMLGTIYRLPERGIRLDFLDRIRRSRCDDAMIRQQFATRPPNHAKSNSLSNGIPPRVTPSSMMSIESERPKSNSPAFSSTAINNVAAAKTILRAKTLREQQAVLSLQALAEQDHASERVLGNPIADLTDKLILGAGEDVVGLEEVEERAQLEGLQKLIQRRLSILQGGGNVNAVKAETDANPNGNGNGNTILVNGDPTSHRGHLGSGSGRGISKSKSKSKSRERRGISRGRK